MKNKWFKKAGLIAMTCMMVFAGSSITAFAQANPLEEETTEDENTKVTSDGIVIENLVDDSEDDENTADTTSDDEDSGILTPEGNLTLVDDLTEAESEELQYMTVTTRDGSYFYIIVDRSGSEQNVYFLNAVDAADLMSLMSDEEQEQYADLISSETQENEDTSIIIDDTTDEEEAEVAQTTEKKSSNDLATLIVFVVIGGLIAGAYYFFKIKPGKGQIDVDEDLEFYDDEEYEADDYANSEDDDVAGNDIADDSDDLEYIDLGEEDS